MSDETFDPGFAILESLDSLDLLVDQYETEIRESFDWEGIVSDAKGNPDNPGIGMYEFPDMAYGITFLGTVFDIMPSGKYYMPWTSNQSNIDGILDTAYNEALDRVAKSVGGWIESGDGDPCDLFFGISLD